MSDHLNYRPIDPEDAAHEILEHEPALPKGLRNTLGRLIADDSVEPLDAEPYLYEDRTDYLLPDKAEPHLTQYLQLPPVEFDTDPATIVMSETTPAETVADINAVEVKKPRHEVSNETLVAEYQAGGVQALGKLIEQNQGLVRSVIEGLGFLQTVMRRTALVDIDDFVQEGSMGLVKAADRYIPGEASFATYARYAIRQAIVTYAKTQSHRLYRLPTNDIGDKSTKRTQDKFNSAFTGKRRADFALWNTISLDTVPYDDATHISDEDDHDGIRHVRATGEFKGRFIRANLPYEASMTTVMRGDDIGTAMAEIDSIDQIQTGLDILTERERSVIMSRFGLINDVPRTLEEVGQLHGVTRERARQIEAKALAKMRNSNVREARLKSDLESFRISKYARLATIAEGKMRHMLLEADLEQNEKLANDRGMLIEYATTLVILDAVTDVSTVNGFNCIGRFIDDFADFSVKRAGIELPEQTNTYFRGKKLAQRDLLDGISMSQATIEKISRLPRARLEDSKETASKAEGVIAQLSAKMMAQEVYGKLVLSSRLMNMFSRYVDGKSGIEWHDIRLLLQGLIAGAQSQR